MNDDGALKLPASGHEFWALALSLVVVFVLVQVGAPIIRAFDFLDPKLRDYFIGMSFAAFPFIHQGCKQSLARLSSRAEPVLHDLTPWYVAGIVAAAVLFGWNQFVSFFTGMSLEIMQQAYPDPQTLNINLEQLGGIQTMAALVIILPLCAVASIYAGMLLNRHTRSHTLAAVGVAAVFFVTINALLTWALNPDYMARVVEMVSAGGPIAAQILFGLSLVGIIVFGFGALGVAISRFKRERPLGRIVEAARKLPGDQRDALAAEITRRLNDAARANASTQVVSGPLGPSAPQWASGAEP